MLERFRERKGYRPDLAEYAQMYNQWLYEKVVCAFEPIYSKNKFLTENFSSISFVVLGMRKQTRVDAETVFALYKANLLQPVLTSSVQEKTNGFTLEVFKDIAVRSRPDEWTLIETSQIVTGFIVQLPERLAPPPQTTVLTLSACLKTNYGSYTLHSDLSRWILQRKQLGNAE